jgi:hypothetical protein
VVPVDQQIKPPLEDYWRIAGGAKANANTVTTATDDRHTALRALANYCNARKNKRKSVVSLIAASRVATG